jgi:CRISPR/Cas system-associated protein Cas10 (large subunit of type III CRISPR-Cas system)
MNKLETFSCGYCTNELKGIVSRIIIELNMPFTNGDILISINNVSLQKLDPATACELSNNKIEKGLEQIRVRYLKNDLKKEVVLNKKRLLKE